jgi:uncharacterized membrane protein YedE/YeeE
MKEVVSSFLIGVLFALGLGIAGMTLPERVVSFLDLFGNWNPSLAVVMLGALAVHAVSYRLIMKRRSPLFALKFELPAKILLDRRLLLGAAIFGLGWGLGGYCPAPALTALASFTLNPILFVTSMIVGMAIFQRFERNLP